MSIDGSDYEGVQRRRLGRLVESLSEDDRCSSCRRWDCYNPDCTELSWEEWEAQERAHAAAADPVLAAEVDRDLQRHDRHFRQRPLLPGKGSEA